VRWSILKLTFDLLPTTMTFSIEQLGEIDNTVTPWCLGKVPPHLKHQIDHDYEIVGQAVTIFEVRPAWRGKPGEITRRPFAKFRFIKTSELWHIYWMRQTGKWNAYQPASVACSLDDALKIVDKDVYGCFFG
jgi:hypothetical protein